MAVKCVGGIRISPVASTAPQPTGSGPGSRRWRISCTTVHGVPVRKTPAILEDLTGIRLTQGAITQHALQQAAGAVGERYKTLRASVREQAVVHTDDNGWRVGG